MFPVLLMLQILFLLWTPTTSVLLGLPTGRTTGLVVLAATEAEQQSRRAAGREGGKREANGPQDRARQAIRSGDYDLARALIRSGLRSKSRSVRDAWRVTEAELEYARKDYPRAGLAAMRVVILSPQSERVGNALYWAGRAYERIGRVSKAVELYEECIEHRTADEKLRDRAEKRLSKLDVDRKSK